MTVDFALATHRPEGIERVERQGLPRMKGVRYVVSWQDHCDAPVPAGIAQRDDIVIHRFDSGGQSLNRNNAIDHCTADIVVNADDDVTYFPEGIRELMEVFERYPGLGVATFRSIHGDPSRFPAESVTLGLPLPAGYSVAGIEIAFRRSAIGSLRFHPELGLGSPRMHGGEDEVFILSAIRRGIDCRFFPITLCEHDGESTGIKSRFTPENVRAAGCVIALMYPCGFPLRIPLKAWRLSRAGRFGFFPALRYLFSGAVAAHSLLRSDRGNLW